MGTLDPTRGAGCREHVQSAPAGKPPEAAEAPGGRRRSAAATRPGGRPPHAPARPQRPPHVPRGAPAGGGPGHGGAPRRPRAGVPPAPVQRRPWQPSGVVRGRAPERRDAPSGFGRPGEARRRDPAGGATRAAPAKHEQGAGRAAGPCVPGNGRPGAPPARPRTAASLRGRVREVPRPVQPAPAPRTTAKSRGQNPRGTQPPPPQVSQRTATSVPGRGGAHARAAPVVPAALQRGRARQQARAGPVAPKERALPHDRTLAAKRAPAAGLASNSRPLQPGPERLRAAARGGALDRHRGTRPDTTREQLPRAPPPQSKCTGPGSCCAPKAAAGASRCAGGAPASRQPAVGTGRDPRTPAPTQDRRQLLEHWVISRGRSYKRPPMSVPAKKPRKKAEEAPERPFRGGLAEKDSEEEKREQLHLADQIATVLAECQQLAEEGFPSEELLPMLSRIPEAERFAQFWICKAKLLARHSTCDVTKLYEAAVCAGAAPIQELRDVVVDILKQAQAPPAKACLFPEEGRAKLRSAQGALQHPIHEPLSAVKLQVLPLLRAKEPGTGQGVKIVTPVRRSLRIEHALARYPLMLQAHDPVVSSLAELMATEKEGQFVFRPNDALAEEGPEALLGL